MSEGRNGGAGSRFAILFSSVTRRKEAEEERSRLRALEASARAERERISRELHDRVAHHMGVAHQRRRETGPCQGDHEGALDQTRALSAELERLQDEELGDGLVAAFGALAESVVPEGVEVDVSFSGEESAVPDAVRT